MSVILRWVKNCTRRTPSSPLLFQNTNYKVIDSSQRLEEEGFEDYETGKYYPARIGDVLASKYQVVGKLGFGVSSTVWLARDLEAHRHVSLKIFTRDHQNDGEIAMYKRLSKGRSFHPGKNHVRTAMGSFTIPRSGGAHDCLVHAPLWGSMADLIARNPYRRKLPVELVRATLLRIFMALDYLHTDRHIIHTDISATNILLDFDDRSALDNFVEQELENPSPRKQVGDSIVYSSRLFRWPTRGEPVLSDFGSAESGDVRNTRNAGPDLYRAPEVMLGMGWSYSVDIWNVGIMIWHLFEGKPLFSGQALDGKSYSTRSHVAEIVAALGSPPAELVKRGDRSSELFGEDGDLLDTVPALSSTSLEQLEGNLQGKDKELFLNFMKSMLQWIPENRKTASELLDDPWLNNEIG